MKVLETILILACGNVGGFLCSVGVILSTNIKNKALRFAIDCIVTLAIVLMALLLQKFVCWAALISYAIGLFVLMMLNINKT